MYSWHSGKLRQPPTPFLTFCRDKYFVDTSRHSLLNIKFDAKSKASSGTLFQRTIFSVCQSWLGQLQIVYYGSSLFNSSKIALPQLIPWFLNGLFFAWYILSYPPRKKKKKIPKVAKIILDSRQNVSKP